MDMAELNAEEKKIVEDFVALTDHGKKCEAFNDPVKNKVLAKIFGAAHFPAPEQPAS